MASVPYFAAPGHRLATSLLAAGLSVWTVLADAGYTVRRMRNPLTGLHDVRAGLAELYTHRALILSLVWRQLATRYRRSVLGVLWTFLNPVLLMSVYSLVFAVYLRVEAPHYPAFVFAGLLPWLWFSSSLAEGVNSIVGGGGLVTRVCFPPQILPTVTVLANLANFLFSLPILLVFLLAYDVPLSAGWIFFPFAVLVQLVFTLGLALFVASLNVHYRDVQHLVGNGLMLWFFLTPVLYPADQVPLSLRPLLWMNPMTAIIQTYHGLLLGRAGYSLPPPGMLALAAGAAVLALAAGMFTLQRLRDSFAEDL